MSYIGVHMKSLSLVKLLRAVGQDAHHESHSYEVKVHAMNGKARTEVIKENDKNRDYNKALKMTGEYQHAVRYINTYKWELISEETYNKLKATWETEDE